MTKQVYYRVNGKEITFDMVHNFVHQMGQEGHSYHNEKGFQQIADELLNQELLYLEAKEEGLYNSEEYKKEVEFAKEQLLKQYAIRNLLSEVEVSEDEIKNLYDKYENEFKDVYKFRASHILVQDEEKAKDLKKQIDEGASFEDLTNQESMDGARKNGGSLGEFLTGQMVPEFENALMEMEVNSVSNPVKTQFGYHLIKLDNRELAKENTYENFRDDLERSLLSQKQQDLYIKKTNQLKEKYEVERVD